jgi:hypothetical protein
MIQTEEQETKVVFYDGEILVLSLLAVVVDKFYTFQVLPMLTAVVAS